MKRIILNTLFVLLAGQNWANNYILLSPDKKIEIHLNAANQISYQLSFNGEELIQASLIRLETNRFNTTDITTPTKKTTSFNSASFPLLWGTSENIQSEYNQLVIELNDSLSIEFRAYNQGFAWRFTSSYSTNMLVYNETAQFNFDESCQVFSGEAKGFSTPFENNYLPYQWKEYPDDRMAMNPLLVKTQKGTNMLISEANLFAYPGMFLCKNGTILQGIFPKYPKKESEQWPGKLRLTNFPQLSKKVVRKTEDYLAMCSGKNEFPWRVVMVSGNDKDLLTNTLIAELAKQADVEKFNWVKPGKVVWDWYNHMNLQGVDFIPGINTQTYLYMIDFAAANRLEYINIDDGWCKLHNFNKVNKNLDIDKILSYAKEKQVGVFIWCTWQTLEKDLVKNLDAFKKMGVAGLKVDFFDRCDQKIVDFINTLALECSKRELLLNLHGMYKPTGIELTFPNVLNLEGVLGLEYNKFSDKCTPTHNLTIPFIRNVVGPMDYTPGAMFYSTPETFEKSWKAPKAMSTRAQQLAMYIVYHGGIQMLSEAATAYESDTITIHFLRTVPVSFDESIALEGEIGKKICLARRKGETWYLGAMAGIDSVTIKLNFEFLPEGNFEMLTITNGNAANSLIQNKKTINKQFNTNLIIPAMGGFVAILKPVY
jgi:alpha-glucosidase